MYIQFPYKPEPPIAGNEMIPHASEKSSQQYNYALNNIINYQIKA